MGGCSVLAKGKTLDDLSDDIQRLTKEADKKHLALDNTTEAVFNKETGMWEQGLHFDSTQWG
jgi:hypothetical protein